MSRDPQVRLHTPASRRGAFALDEQAEPLDWLSPPTPTRTGIRPEIARAQPPSRGPAELSPTARVPYPLVAAGEGRPRTVIRVGDRQIGASEFALIAGPCTVESAEQTLATAQAVAAADGVLLRGGAYKPRTSPYAFDGLGAHGLRLLAEAKHVTGLPVVTEIMDPRDLPAVLEVADVLQIGARNMQNYPLLTEVGRCDRPVLLKRGLSATLEELMMAAERVLKEGNQRVILCERGIRTFETAYRFTLDVAAVPTLRRLSHLPVIVDPSHAAGRRDLIMPLSLAAAAVGADGIMVEVHPDPEEARCDGEQALHASELVEVATMVRAVAEVVRPQEVRHAG